MLSTRLYKTSLRRSFFVSSFASAQGIVSSIYLLHLLKRVNISVIASATWSVFILSSTFAFVPVTTALSSASKSRLAPFSSVPAPVVSAPVFATLPPKYLFDMAIVLFTRLPSVLARSEFIRSTISSHEITPSFSKGISWRTKYLTASTPNISTRSSA